MNTDMVNASHFAALEPTWSGINDEFQLKGLLILGTLFNKKIYIYDTQIADNPHLLQSYYLSNDNDNNIFHLISFLIKENIIHVGVRDLTYLAKDNENITCNCLMDVYESWKKQDIEKAWVVEPTITKRLDLLNHFDSIINKNNSFIYPYLKIKKKKKKNISIAFEQNRDFQKIFNKLPKRIQNDYRSILKRNWYSHSDIFDLLVRSNIPIQSKFVQYHGLFDEMSFSQWNNTRLLGCNMRLLNVENILFDESHMLKKDAIFPRSIQKKALKTINADGLSLIATLSPSDILQLREKGENYFNLIEHIGTHQMTSDLADNFIDCFIEYWSEIIKYINNKRPYLTKNRTKIGIFTRDYLPHVPNNLKYGIKFSLNIGLDLLRIDLLKNLTDGEKNDLINLFNYNFVIYSDSPGMKNLKTIFPNRMWISRCKNSIDGGVHEFG